MLHYLRKQQGIYTLKIGKKMEHETFLNQVDLETPFQADLELEADEFE